MKAYRVAHTDPMGFDREIAYFLKLIDAQAEHEKRISAARIREDLVDFEDTDGEAPIKEHYDPLHLRSTWVSIWETWSNENGTESEIVGYEIITDEIEIAE